MQVAWLGEDVPLELLDAAGCRLSRLDADPAAPGAAAAGYTEGGGHPQVHALASAMMALGAAGTLPVIGALPVAQSAVFRFFQCLPEETPGRPSLWQLSHVPSAAARRFNRAAMARFAQSCGTELASLPEAIRRRNGLRASFARLAAMAAEQPPRLSGSQAAHLHRLYGTGEENGLEAMLPRRERAEGAGGTRVLLTGPATSETFLRALEHQVFHIAGFAAGFGAPEAPETVREDGDPLDALAEAYGAPIPCAAGWMAAMLARVEALRVQAVLFAFPAYDHPTAWIVPSLRVSLAERGVRSLVAPIDFFRDPHGAARALAAEWQAA